MSFNFKKDYSFVRRHSEAMRVREKHPDRIPTIVEKNPECKGLPALDKNKYLVPNDLTVGQFIYVIRRRIHIRPEKAVFIFVDNNLPSTSTLMGELYYSYSDDDGFLYIRYSGENTFG